MIGQKLQSHVEPLEFPCDTCNKASDQSVLTDVNADWAVQIVAAHRCSNSCWVKDAGQWYPVGFTSRKQCTVALSSRKSELVADVNGNCRVALAVGICPTGNCCQWKHC